MEYKSLGCQVCLVKFTRVFEFKKHMHSWEHQEKMKEVFQKDVFKGRGILPYICVMDPVARKDMKQPIVGLSQLTLCFSPQSRIFFYLCHVCEEKCPPCRIATHLSSGDHCSNYFSYRDPNVLSFSWIPSKGVGFTLRPALLKEVCERGQGELQMLDLPEQLLKKLEPSVYSEVMSALSENDKLLKLLDAVKPKRTMIQTYQTDSNRKHPLLGMQHLVECICVKPTEKTHYLCTLCNLTLGAHMIIKHVLSFDHIFCYFRAWHPSTLLAKECYNNYTMPFVSLMLDFAKQTEEIHGTANAAMKQVRLEPAQFASVNFTCYAEALKKLESIAKENESSLITSIKPGNKLECRAVSMECVVLSLKILCQNCGRGFASVDQYFQHVVTRKHKKMLDREFGQDKRGGCDQSVWRHNPDSFWCLKETLGENQTVIGLHLVVACVSSQVHMEPIYVCFACEDCFLESFLREHLNSQKHVIQTLLYQNPWQLPFGWQAFPNLTTLKSLGCKEEMERGAGQMMLKVLDLPHWIFRSLNPHNYRGVMKRMERHHAVLQRKVPLRETHLKLKQNERFPLLGREFLVKHDVCFGEHHPIHVGFLCLLCKLRLSDDECCAHVFSWAHVATFLDSFHPGSLNSSTDTEALLDLAQQATDMHGISNVQEIELDIPIWERCSYTKAMLLLASTKRRCGGGKLTPPIIPKMKLVPRGILKDVAKDQVRDNSQNNSRMKEESETCPGSTAINDTALKKTSVEVYAEVTNTHCVGSAEISEKGTDRELEKRSEVSSQTVKEEVIKNETCQTIEEPTSRKRGLESCHNTDKTVKTEEEMSPCSSDVPTQWMDYTCKKTDRKRRSRTSENSQGDKCPHESEEIEKHKKRRLTCKQEPFPEEYQNLQGSGQRDETIRPADKGDGGKPSTVNIKNKGLSALLKCCCDHREPIYLCECCSLKIAEEDVISHVSGADHQMIYQQVVDLDEELYNGILNQNFESAMQTLKALQAQQVSQRELRSTLALSDAQPMKTLVTCHTQHVQVVKMEIDDDSEAQPSSVTAAMSFMTDNTCKTDVKMTHVKLSQLPDNANACPTVSRRGGNVSSLRVSTSSTNTICLHPDSTGNDFKVDINSKKSVGPLDIAATSKTAGTSHTVVTSDSVVTTSTKSKVPTSRCTAKSSSSTLDATKSTASLYRSNTGPTTFGESALKYPACKSSATAATSSKRAGATSSSCATISSSTKSAKLSKPLENRTAPEHTATASNTQPPVAHDAAHRTTPGSEMENASRNSETASKPVVTSAASAKTTKTSVQYKNIEASEEPRHVKNSLGSNADVTPNIPKSNAATTPHPAPTEPPHTSLSKTKPKVGIDQLIAVSWKEKKQVYCQLCSVRLINSDHVYSRLHYENYVKLKYPGWTKKSDSLEKIVANLAEVERQVGSRSLQTVTVSFEMYMELRHLPEDTVVERLKAMLRQRDWSVSSSTNDAAEVLRQQVAWVSPVSSPDDANIKQGTSHLHVTATESHGTHQAFPLASSQSEEGGSGSHQNDLQTATSPFTQDAGIAVSVKQENMECDVDLWANPRKSDAFPPAIVPATFTASSPIQTVKMEFEDYVDPLTFDSEPGGRFAQPPDACQEAPQKRGDPGSVKFFNTDPLSSSASVNIDQQTQARPSQKAEEAVIHSPGGPPGVSQALPRISIGERTQGCSHLSRYLTVKGLGNAPIIGLSSVWECRGISLNPFFLCESCRETLSLCDICQHMISNEHQLKYLLRQYPDCEAEIHHKMKANTLNDLAQWISIQERSQKMDAQGILLGEELYSSIRAAPFSEALEMVQNIRKKLKLRAPFQLTSTPQRMDLEPEVWHTREESPPTEMHSAMALDTDWRRDNEARQETEKRHLEEAGHLQRTPDSSLFDSIRISDHRSVSAKPCPVVSPLPESAACLSPQEKCRSLSVQPELRPPASQHQRPVLTVKAEVHSEAPPSSAVVPETTQTLPVSPSDGGLPPWQRRAVSSLETHVTPNDNLVIAASSSSVEGHLTRDNQVFRGQQHTGAQSFLAVTKSPSGTLSEASAGGYSQYSQTAAGYTAPANPAAHTGSLYQREAYATPGRYPGQFYPEQEANHFGHNLATQAIPGWVSQEMQQQQHLMQQQQHLMQQQQLMQQLMQQHHLMQQQQLMQRQQLMQQQYPSWSSAAVAAGDGRAAGEAACLGAFSVVTPAVHSSSSPWFIDPNKNITTTPVPMHSNHNMVTSLPPPFSPSPSSTSQQ